MAPSANSIRRFWPILLFALLPIVPLWRCVFLGEAIGPFDQIRQMAPWNGPPPAQPWDVLQADGVLQFYPWRDMVFKSWAHGHLPLWNNFELAGTPLLANSQSAGFYPPHVFVGLLHVPTAPAMTLLAWFHLFWSGLGLYLLSRQFGASRGGAAIGGVSFQLSAFMLAWAALPSVISTVAWIPWLLVGVVRLTGEAANWKRGLSAMAFSGGMMLLAGHLQFAAYGFLAAAFLGVGLVWIRRSWRALGLGVIGVILAGGLAAPQLLPVLRYSQWSHRRNVPTSEGYRAYVGGAIQPYALGNLTHPNALGSPRENMDLQGTKVQAYWPATIHTGDDFSESALTLGPLLLGLLVLVPWRDRRLWLLAVLAGIALLLALGTPLNALLYFGLPGWSSTGSPGRVIVLFILCACVLGACASAGAPRKRIWAAGGLALFGYLVSAAVAMFTLPSVPGIDNQALATLAQQTIWSVAPVALAGGLLAAIGIFALADERYARYRPTAVAIAAVLPIAFGAHLIMTGVAIPIQPPKDFSRVAVINKDWSLHVAAPAIAPPNTAYLLGLRELGGYDSLLHRETKALLDSINGEDSAPQANGNMMFIKPHGRDLNFWMGLAGAGVSDLVSRNPEDGADFRDVGPVGRVRVMGQDLKPKIVAETPQSISVSATGPGRFVLTDRNMPGWLAKVDGRHVPTQGTMWRELDLGPGEHHIEFNYVPPGLVSGVLLGGTAALILGALTLWPRRPA